MTINKGLYMLINQRFLIKSRALRSESKGYGVRLLTSLFFLVLLGCQTSPQKHKMSPELFAQISEGKRVFMVGGAISSGNELYGLCDNFYQSICSKSLNDYSGVKGFMYSSKPSFEDNYYIGYIVAMETDEKLVLKLSKIYKDKDPIESSLFLLDYENYKTTSDSLGRPLMDGLSVKMNNAQLYGGSIKVNLSNGETLSKKELDERLLYLQSYIGVKDRDAAFALFQHLNIRFDDFEKQWWIKPKSNQEMNVYPYFGSKISSKWLRFKAMYTGYDWIFFESIKIISNSNTYERKYAYSDITKDNAGGKVWEYVDISMGKLEREIVDALSKGGGKVRFSGKYSSTKEISVSQSREIKAVLELYKVTKTTI